MIDRADNDERYLSREASDSIVQRVRSFMRDGGTIFVNVESWWNGELRWARNRVNLAADRCNTEVQVTRILNGGASGNSSTNQLDNTSLEAVVRAAERRAHEPDKQNVLAENILLPPQLPKSSSIIWSDETYGVTAAHRSEIAQFLSEEAEEKGMVSAGYFETRAGSSARWSDARLRDDYDSHIPMLQYERLTQAQCSMTVRHPKGTGSGWAGLSTFDYTKVDPKALAKSALDKCIASLNPVRIEPGRYTLIMEPQAVCDFVESLMGVGVLGWRNSAEGDRHGHPLWLGRDEALEIGRSKLGMKIVDERITISHDPSDPSLGVVPKSGMGPCVWIDRGTLVTIGEGSHRNARETRRVLVGDLWRPSFRVSGGMTTIQEMIETTKRGLLVTRFSDITELDRESLLGTGYYTGWPLVD